MQKTNWCVITGAPCSGKTAVISALEQLGYPVVHETARTYIDEELYKKIEIEKSLSKDATVFLDRAVLDSIGYYILEGLSPDEPIKKSKQTRYKKIFLFERLRFEKDDVRLENDKIAAELNRILKESYQMLGYEIISVPLLSINDRVDFILKCL